MVIYTMYYIDESVVILKQTKLWSSKTQTNVRICGKKTVAACRTYKTMITCQILKRVVISYKDQSGDHNTCITLTSPGQCKKK